MRIAEQVLASNDDLPIRTDVPVHSGKVRAVYWLTAADSARLISSRDYPVAAAAPLAVMVISDRLSAFDCIWHGEGNLHGVPGKGAALNAIAGHWFDRFRQRGLAGSHVLEVPHPLVWVVQRARPVRIEAIARQYITGSMWRAYADGERSFCGIELPDGLSRDQKLPELLVTPSTKGVIEGVPGVAAADDVNISRERIVDNFSRFGFESAADIARYESLLEAGFRVISDELASVGQIFVDTKFEFGYVGDEAGDSQLIYMDEVGTPDSSRIWDAEAYRQGRVVENSKEGFRQRLLGHFADPDVLLDKARMPEREALARATALPADWFMDVSSTYVQMAERITGSAIALPEQPREEIVAVLADEYGLIR